MSRFNTFQSAPHYITPRCASSLTLPLFTCRISQVCLPPCRASAQVVQWGPVNGRRRSGIDVHRARKREGGPARDGVHAPVATLKAPIQIFDLPRASWRNSPSNVFLRHVLASFSKTCQVKQGGAFVNTQKEEGRLTQKKALSKTKSEDVNQNCPVIKFDRWFEIQKGRLLFASVSHSII